METKIHKTKDKRRDYHSFDKYHYTARVLVALISLEIISGQLLGILPHGQFLDKGYFLFVMIFSFCAIVDNLMCLKDPNIQIEAELETGSKYFYRTLDIAKTIVTVACMFVLFL